MMIATTKSFEAKKSKALKTLRNEKGSTRRTLEASMIEQKGSRNIQQQ
jgi:hypothetical protein